MPVKPSGTPVSAEVELEQLRTEVVRLHELIGPNEQSYIKLKTDVWSARDAVIGAEAEVGLLRGRVRSLEAELTRAIKEQQWFKAEIINRLKAYRLIHRKVIGRARRTLVK
jgi:predicted  nucleic acid-binding Zn-ribbon protein